MKSTLPFIPQALLNVILVVLWIPAIPFLLLCKYLQKKEFSTFSI